MGSYVNRSRGTSRRHRIYRCILGVPLVAKLIGANVIIVAASIAVQAAFVRGASRAELFAVVVALAGASVANVFLVRLALDPIRQLQDLANRVSAGEFAARVDPSPLADMHLTQLTTTLNGLLDSLAGERSRIQALGAEVVFAQDAERARISRELHDSIAQTLAAARFQVVAARGEAPAELQNKLTAIGSLLGSVMEQVKNVSYSLHPRVAEDLGLESALTSLAKQVYERSRVKVNVTVSIAGEPLPQNISATLFRVAQEALRNIEMHASAKSASIDVNGRNGSIRIEVSDDGCGFDQAWAVVPACGSGLARVRDRVALAGGSMSVDSIPNGGTRVTAELKTLKAAS